VSRMADLIIDIQDELAIGELSFSEIATKFEVPVSWVVESAEMMEEEYNDE
jgi:hypothetical protein